MIAPILALQELTGKNQHRRGRLQEEKEEDRKWAFGSTLAMLMKNPEICHTQSSMKSIKQRCHPTPCGFLMWSSSCQVGQQTDLRSYWELGPLEAVSERGDQAGLATNMRAESYLWWYIWQVQPCIMEVMKGSVQWAHNSPDTNINIHRHKKGTHAHPPAKYSVCFLRYSLWGRRQIQPTSLITY